MVYYLKYRPQILKELDNKRVAEILAKYLVKKDIPHAFLFTGSKGTGKTSTARIIAKSVNCSNAENGQACGVCENCVHIGKGENLDILEIDAASNRGIDEIRDLREKIKLSPLSLKYKVYIIDEVHMLTTEAFNALLKTLEEPPAHALFILATTETHKVPDTIKSRCVRIDFQKATPQDTKNSLKRIIAGEKLTIDEDAIDYLALVADGSFRDAAKILEQVALIDEKITLISVQKALGGTDSTLEADFLEKLRVKQAKELLAIIIELEQTGKNIQQFFLRILHSLEKILLDSFRTQESTWKREELIVAIRYLQQAFVELKTAVIPTLPFELAIIEYAGQVSALQNTKLAPNAKIDVEQVAVVDVGVDESVAPIIAKWADILESIKAKNHSIVGVLRSCRPYSLSGDTFTIEANYKFHAERLAEIKVCEVIAQTLQELLGLKVKIATVIKKKV